MDAFQPLACPLRYSMGKEGQRHESNSISSNTSYCLGCSFFEQKRPPINKVIFPLIIL